jgi:hypothetical protein
MLLWSIGRLVLFGVYLVLHSFCLLDPIVFSFFCFFVCCWLIIHYYVVAWVCGMVALVFIPISCIARRYRGRCGRPKQTGPYFEEQFGCWQMENRINLFFDPPTLFSPSPLLNVKPMRKPIYKWVWNI